MLLAALLLSCAADPVLADLEVEAVPNPLAARVHWTTSEPGPSRVEVRGGGLAFAVQGEGEATEHEVLVYGLVPETAFTLEAVTEVDELRLAASATFTTRRLPFEPLGLEVSTHLREAADEGWILLDIVTETFLLSPSIAVALDREGRVRWVHHMGEGIGPAGVEVRPCGPDAFSIGGSLPPLTPPSVVGLDGEVRWEGDLQPTGWFDPGANHHTFQCLEGGEFLGLYYDKLDGDVLGDYAVASDRDGVATWSWRAWDWVPEAADEHIHLNMVQLEDDRAYLNSFFLSELYAVDRESGEFLWTLGPEGDFSLAAGTWFDQAHGFEVLPGGTVLMYDNGIEREWSRAVEYALDEDALIAEEIWAWPPEEGEESWFNNIWGDADRLPSGNTLISGGSMWSVDDPCRLVEVSPDGDVVWELHFAMADGEPAGTYAAQWFDPGLLPLE